jgi:hypothetical protein
MDAPWPRTWPEMAELHVFDPEGDVLLILDCCLKDDDLVESVDEEKKKKGKWPRRWLRVRKKGPKGGR